MAELLLSAFLGVLFEKLASATVKNITRYKGIDADMKKWQRSLDQIQNVLTDASQKEITNQSVKRWLNDLQHLAYDIDDLLDELATEAVHHEFTRESEPITSKVRKLIPSCCTNFSPSTTMHDKLDNITTKLQELVEEKAALGLRVEEEVRPRINNNRRLQTSIVDASSIVGRRARKEELVHQLLLDEPCDQNFSIVPIVGMGGVGKTTLARLLYDEEKVNDHFKLKAWVCVSDEFDSFGISKVIYQSVVGAHKKFADLNLLQVDLVNHLRGKKFLLVLDDVWTESYEDWETLVAPFHACASGSKIVMTTRKEQLLKQLGYDHLNKLEVLLHDDALSLFCLHALGVDNFDSHLSLKPYGEGIVKKCGGLPLGLIALGKSLRAKKDEDCWKEVLESEIWKSKDRGLIIPALRLSYHDLSARLKQLFAYCSLFPKDFMFDKKELILLWMAEGFLHPSTQSDSKQEKLGHEYFDELLSKSFFQHAPNNESLFVMHDLMNDLATYVAGEFFLRFGNETETLKRYRHMSFVREYYTSYKKCEAFTRAKSLRTFLATSVGEESWWKSYISNQILVDLLPELPLLRVLCLSNFRISEVPDSIGTLRHLRYLNLSRTEITNLPENMCNLYNLETLILFGCRELTKLPNSFLKLKNLRHLDIRDTPLLDQMPLGIGELKSLQTLSKIIIGGEHGFEMAKLKDFKNLHGTISIVGLDKVQNAIHAREAKFSEKRFSELEFVWSDASDGFRNEMLEKEVLNELKPGNDKLIQLKIRSYEGLEFPNWVADPLFLQLKHISILGCKRCISLPPLAQIPSLKELFIGGLYGVEFVGLELFGTSSTFRSLEILSFEDMPGWKNWSANNGVMFPCLKQLFICDCPKLVEVTLALPTLNVLDIIGCDSSLLRRLVEIASVVTTLKIYQILGLDYVVWRGVIEYLQAVEDLSITDCNEIKYLWESEVVASKVFVNLKKLKVSSCDNLVSLGENEEEEDSCRSKLLTSLTMLDVSGCKNMERCNCPDSIETLTVLYCNSITALSLPAGGQKLKTLYIDGCINLLEREWGGQKMNSRSSMSMLKDVRIYGWSNLKSIIEVNLLVHLTDLSISNCEGLESFPDNELSNLTSLKKLSITHCPSMNASFPRGVWPPNLHILSIGKLKKPVSEWGPQNFPTSLSDLYLYGGEDGVSSCSQISHLLPSSLTYLQLTEFKKLESVSTGLQHLTSLKHLCFENCPKIKDLPEVLFPSLLSLGIIGNCPILKEKCSKRGCYWPLISHIPHIWPNPSFISYFYSIN